MFFAFSFAVCTEGVPRLVTLMGFTSKGGPLTARPVQFRRPRHLSNPYHFSTALFKARRIHSANVTPSRAAALSYALRSLGLHRAGSATSFSASGKTGRPRLLTFLLSRFINDCRSNCRLCRVNGRNF